MNVILVALVILLLIGVGLVVWHLQRLRASLANAAGKLADINATFAESVVEQRVAFESLREQTKRALFREEPVVVRSPLEGLSFSAALSLTPMWDGIQRSSNDLVKKQFAAYFGDVAVVGTNAIHFAQSTGEYVIEFSEQGRELLELGKATLMKSKETGQMIPQLIGLDGKIIETGKEVGKLKSVAGKLSSLSSMVVGAAHIISGADVAKTVAEVRRDVKFLVEARNNSQMAKLESIYHSAQQILASPLTEHAQWELRRQTREIAELRATWRMDLETKLHRMDDPNNAGFLQRYFRTQRSKDKQVASGISEGQEDLALIEVSMVMQIALAHSIGDTDALFNRAFPSELNLLRRTGQLLAEKAVFISGNSPDVHVEPMIAAINDLIDRMSVLSSEVSRYGNN